MQTAALSLTVLVAQMHGDRPAIITKVMSNTHVQVCAFMPLPEVIDLVKLHSSRKEALNASLAREPGTHAYWPAKV